MLIYFSCVCDSDMAFFGLCVMLIPKGILEQLMTELTKSNMIAYNQLFAHRQIN